MKTTLWAAILLLGTMGSVTAGTDVDALAVKWASAWNSHDVERVIPLFTDDVVYEDVAIGQVNKGAEQLRKFAKFFFDVVPDLKIDVTGSHIKGGHGYIEWTLSGTDVGIFKTNRKFSIRGSTVLDVDRTKISRDFDYYNVATLMEQVGVQCLPQPAAP
jgi:steroid delta-isomerase-like uncharacterized protein